MARPYIARALREKIMAEARYRCGYCLTPRLFTAMPMHVEHIIPLAAGGSSDEDNLWLACALCNGYKREQTHRIDPLTGERVPLFNPRRQIWNEHFRWSEDGINIVGQTACGRATVIALKLNNPYFRQARSRWFAAGWHPPTD